MSAIELLIESRTRPVGSGTVERLLPHRQRPMVGPFIFLDHLGPEQVPTGVRLDVDAHPHIGLSTLTYLFAGAMVHRDSTGAVAEIQPGAVNWMTAGAGVCHTERSRPEDVDVTYEHHGLQLWVALPDGAEDGEPFFEHRDASAIPTEQANGAIVRLAAGTGFELTSPVAVSSPLVLAELVLSDASVRLDATHPERAVLVVEGALTLEGSTLPGGQLAVLQRGATAELRGTGRAILLGGEPVGPRHIWWNFVHSDRERIEVAKQDWNEQRFPLVPGDHDPWVPLP